MKQSSLQFKNPILEKLDYKINKNFEDESIDLKFKIKIEINKSKLINSALVRVDLNLFEDEKENYPFNLNVCMSAKFIWDEEFSDDIVDRLLRTNAPSIIISYMRPYVTMITSASGYRPLILPLLNLSNNEDVIINYK